MNLWHFLGNWHPKLVQFPLVLLLTGLLFDLAGLLFRSARAHWAALILTASGTLSLLFAFICGIYAEIWAGRAGIPQHPIELHEFVANIASWGFVLLFAWRILLRTPAHAGAGETSAVETGNSKRTSVYVVTGLLWYFLLLLTAYLGGQLVFAYGAGVTGATPNAMLTLEDLNTLASRQTDKNLWYSEWMHHIFGLMTLGLAASLLAQALFPKSTPRLRWIVPTFLLAGGIFLFFRADSDLYAFTDPRQWRDREVQLHKSLALIMTTIGAIGLYRIFKPAKEPKTEEVQPAGAMNSRLVAILALIGGALLFTHVHTVAPYANVAAGVYIAHVVLGLIALSIGATRLLQDYWPGRQRPLAIGFALLMGIEAILLITYNEGLPWYIGYGTYNRWGPHEAPEPNRSIPVAPFGDFRAEMLVDPVAGNVYVVMRDRYNEDEVKLKFDAPPLLLLNQRGTEIAIPLAHATADGVPRVPVPGDPADLYGDNFSAHAEFLKDAPYLNARLVLKIAGRERTGYFDPWVTPAITAVPPNEMAKFQCPMHEGIRTTQAGTCPLCQMELIPIRAPLAAGQLHDSKYQLQVEVEAAADQPAPNRAQLLLNVVDDARKNVPLAQVHEQWLHAVIVSEDLTWFDHLHPAQLAARDGSGNSYALPYSFPHAGRYLLFSDVTPLGDRAQIFRTALVVDAQGVHLAPDAAPHNILVADAVPSRLAASIPFPKTPQDSAPLNLAAPLPPDMHAELITQPRTLYAGMHAQLIVRLSDAAGKPIADIAPYLGAAGHGAIVSQDTQIFIHSHPEQFRPITPTDRFGPDIAFHATFPAAGTYRLWAQFKRGDRLLIIPFTIKVEDPPIPAPLLRFLLNE